VEHSPHLDNTPTMDEIQHALQHMSSVKAPGVDGIPAEVLKHGGSSLITHLTNLISKTWEEELDALCMFTSARETAPIATIAAGSLFSALQAKC